MASEKWHVDKAVSLANILVVVSLAFSGFGAYNTITDRMAVLETTQDSLNSRIVSLIERQINTDNHQDDNLQMFRQEWRADTQTIQGKLDRLIERQ